MTRKKKTVLEKLREQYDNEPLLAIEQGCDEAKELSLENDRKRIQLLYYLERTNRFRENPQYKNATFDVYLRYRHGIRAHTYHERRIAFIAHEKEALTYGPGLVAKVRRECGPLKVSDVFSKIKPTNGHDKIEKIIQAHAKPKPDRVVVEKASKTEIELKKLVADQKNEIAALQDQLGKAKAAASYWKGLYKELRQTVMPTLKVMWAQQQGEKLPKETQGDREAEQDGSRLEGTLQGAAPDGEKPQVAVQ
jgi:hypothetical protein